MDKLLPRVDNSWYEEDNRSSNEDNACSLPMERLLVKVGAGLWISSHARLWSVVQSAKVGKVLS